MILETLKLEIRKKAALCVVLRRFNPLCTTSCE